MRIEHALTPRLSVDWAKLPAHEIDAAQIPLIAQMAPTVDGKADYTRVSEIRLHELAERFRYQKTIFRAARMPFEGASESWHGWPDFLLGQLIGLVEPFIRSDHIAITPALFAQSDLHRRVLLSPSMSRIVQHVRGAIVSSCTESRALVLDDRPIRSTGDMRPWHTSRRSEATRRSHIHRCVYDSTWEASEAHTLDHEDQEDVVAAWARNDHLGFEVRYLQAAASPSFAPISL